MVNYRVTLNVRQNPSINAQIVGQVSQRTQGTILEGPMYDPLGGGYTWWKIQYSTGVAGWSAENYLRKIGDSGALVLDSVNFNQGLVLGQETTISFRGANFKPGAKAFYGVGYNAESINNELPTTFISSNELRSVITLPLNLP